jgi:hypothetical protein
MPRFYFHIKHGADLFRDEEGVDLESTTLAHAHALQSAREYWRMPLRQVETRK